MITTATTAATITKSSNGKQLVFDYSGYDPETRIVVQQREGEVRSLIRRAASDVLDIGRKLIDVRDRLPPDDFIRWLDSCFGMSHATAARMISVADRFGGPEIGGIPRGAEIHARALYLLAAPTVPEDARKEAIRLAVEEGKTITEREARSVITQERERRQPPLAPSLLVPTPPPQTTQRVNELLARAKAGMSPETLAEYVREEERALLDRQRQRDEDGALQDREEMIERGRTRIRQAALCFRRVEFPPGPDFFGHRQAVAHVLDALAVAAGLAEGVPMTCGEEEQRQQVLEATTE